MGARGQNWLFFGDQRAATDYLFREEVEAMHAEGTLHRLDLAFSRDQAEKVYVQHRMLAHARELYAWLEAGGHFYVCGDAGRMAKDVDAALKQIVQSGGGKTLAQATEYVQDESQYWVHDTEVRILLALKREGEAWPIVHEVLESAPDFADFRDLRDDARYRAWVAAR